MKIIRGFIIGGVALFAVNTHAVDTGIAPLGVTGALSTPIAKTLDLGEGAVAFSRYLDGQGIDTEGYNYLVGAGVLPDVELFLRLATNTIADNCFTESCGIRDLSASGKWVLPSLTPIVPSQFQPWLPRVAVGATDVGGAETNFRTVYGVVTWDKPTWAVSLGMSKAQTDRAVRANLDGPFGSVVLQPVPWFQAIAEHDGTEPQAGIRLLTIPDDLPLGLRLQAELRTGAPRDGGSRSLWWGLAARVPLGGSVDTPRYAAAWRPTETVAPTVLPIATQKTSTGSEQRAAAFEASPDRSETPETQVNASRHADTTVISEAIKADLKQHLQQAGLEAVKVTQQDARLLIRFENQAWLWNDIDAYAMVFAEFVSWSRRHALATVDAQFVMTKESQPVMSVVSDATCLSAYLESGIDCSAGVLRDMGQADAIASTREAGLAQWLPSFAITDAHFKPRLELAPVLDYAVGTEFGSLDYSVALGATTWLPLPAGLLAEARFVQPLDESKDYQSGGVFAESRLESGIDRALLHHYHVMPYGFATHAAVGQVDDDSTGGFIEGRWQSPRGQHVVGLIAGDFTSDDDVESKPTLASYSYQFERQDVLLGVQFGEFFDADVGYRLSSRFAFRDTFVTAFYRQTKTDLDPESVAFAGVELSLPLGPRKTYQTAFGQLRGKPDFQLALQTKVGEQDNLVAQNQLRGRFSTVPGSLNTQLYNRQRLSPQYFAAQLPRLRQAFEQYRAGAWRKHVTMPSLTPTRFELPLSTW